ncbi:SDR family NAD(P)-dependent oxidoreductase [Imbroritus primus]|uniref:SDR family NAD(P)-dependent oxidoreductase n=1 Tax=Imbroritus primus TaxID=3058603 RepID=A0ACD3SPV0_9BURK|nr:SDR family NAD(P)-dependent oxidoreductase [Burkholderiaceae bacterium PBA]
MNLVLTGKRVLITGASRGIGLACAVAFAKEGAIPVLVVRKADDLRVAADDIFARTGIQSVCHDVDLSTEEGIDTLIATAG